MNSNTHAHIVPVAHPLFFILRIIQIVLAVILLGLFAYLAWAYNTIWGSATTVFSGAVGVGLFTVILTIILGVYYLVSTLATPAAYNRWAVVGLEAAAALFWLITFALTADSVALSIDLTNTSNNVVCDTDGYCYYTKRDLAERDVTYGTWDGIWYASLALSVIEWILFMVSLVLFSLALHKHRTTTATTNVAEQGYTPKQMEAGPAPPAPEYQQQQHVPQPTYEHQPTYEQQPMQQHPVSESQPAPMH